MNFEWYIMQKKTFECVCVCQSVRSQSEFNGIFFWIVWLKKMNINMNDKNEIALHTYYADVNASHCKLPIFRWLFREFIRDLFFSFGMLKSSEICPEFTDWFIYFQSKKMEGFLSD